MRLIKPHYMKNFILLIICSALIPLYISAQFKSIGGDGSTTVSKIIVKGDTIYASGDSGLYKSYDGGLTWKEIPGSRLLGDIEKFHINGDIIVVVNINKMVDNRKMTIHISQDGGLNWIKKDIVRYYGFYDFYDNELSITIHQNIITLATYDEIFVSKDLGVTFSLLNNNTSYHLRSDYIYYENGFHYIIEDKKVIKTNDFTSFTDVYVAPSGSISGFFKNSLSIYIYNNGAHQLIGDSFENIEMDPSLFDNGKTYSFDESFVYTYEMWNYEVNMYDYEFNLIKVYDFSTLFDELSYNNKFTVNGGFIYYFTKDEKKLFKKALESATQSAVEIAGNIKTGKGEYVMVDDRLWQIDFRLSYYDYIIQQWLRPNIKYEQNDYAIVDKNSLIITRPISIVNLNGLKIRNTSIPSDYKELFNCSDIIMARDFTDTRIYTLIDGILPWIKIDEEITWESIKTEFSNGFYILHNEKDEILFTQNKYTWQKIKLNASTIGNQKISSVQTTNNGQFYLTAGHTLYIYNPTSNVWTKVNNTIHPYGNEIITDLAIFKDIMIQTYYGYGVVISLDFGVTWQKFEEGLSDPYMTDIFIGDTHLYVSNQYDVFERQISDIPGLSSTENITLQTNTSVLVSPNPAIDLLNYKIKGTEKIIAIHIYTKEGKLVLQQLDISKNEGQIDIQLLASGQYFINFKTSNDQYITTIFKL